MAYLHRAVEYLNLPCLFVQSRYGFLLSLRSRRYTMQQLYKPLVVEDLLESK
jgi:hypothetical protein